MFHIGYIIGSQTAAGKLQHTIPRVVSSHLISIYPVMRTKLLHMTQRNIFAKVFRIEHCFMLLAGINVMVGQCH